MPCVLTHHDWMRDHTVTDLSDILFMLLWKHGKHSLFINVVELFSVVILSI